jgi:hypothetical protein
MHVYSCIHSSCMHVYWCIHSSCMLPSTAVACIQVGASTPISSLGWRVSLSLSVNNVCWSDDVTILKAEVRIVPAGAILQALAGGRVCRCQYSCFWLAHLGCCVVLVGPLGLLCGFGCLHLGCCVVLVGPLGLLCGFGCLHLGCCVVLLEAVLGLVRFRQLLHLSTYLFAGVG